MYGLTCLLKLFSYELWAEICLDSLQELGCLSLLKLTDAPVSCFALEGSAINYKCGRSSVTGESKIVQQNCSPLF